MLPLTCADSAWGLVLHNLNRELISKSTSVFFASPDIGEAHADTSSAAAEIFAAGNAAQDIMGIKYMVEEMGMDFPTPFILEMDNEAARI